MLPQLSGSPSQHEAAGALLAAACSRRFGSLAGPRGGAILYPALPLRPAAAQAGTALSVLAAAGCPGQQM